MRYGSDGQARSQPRTCHRSSLCPACEAAQQPPRTLIAPRIGKILSAIRFRKGCLADGSVNARRSLVLAALLLAGGPARLAVRLADAVGLGLDLVGLAQQLHLRRAILFVRRLLPQQDVLE